MGEKIRIFGAPGTGKTEHLLRTVEKFLDDGIDKNDIMYCTFMKASITDAKIRAAKKIGIEPKEIMFFGTMHSLCYRLIDVDSKSVVNEDMKMEFCEKRNIEYSISNKKEDIEDISSLLKSSDKCDGNIIFGFYDYLRLVKRKDMDNIGSFKEITKYWIGSTFSQDFDFGKIKDVIFGFLSEWYEHKKSLGLIDFCDMLMKVYRDKMVYSKKVMFFDEFQDFTPLMYEIFEMWQKNADYVYIAGDDDQTIFSYSGADPKYLLNFKVDKEIMLDKTYRLSDNIRKFTEEFISRNRIRKNKKFRSIKKGGTIKFYNDNMQGILPHIRKNKKTYILFRINAFVSEMSKHLISIGEPFHYIKGRSIWSNRFVNINNAIFKLLYKKPLTYNEMYYFIDSIYVNPYIVRGIKTKFKNGKFEKRDYNFDELGMFFNDILFNYLETPENLIKVLKGISNIRKQILFSRLVYKKYNGIIDKINIYLSTIHKSKGLEADDVFLATNVTNKISNSLIDNDKMIENMEQERRVFYVGSTRAKKRVVICHFSEWGSIETFYNQFFDCYNTIREEDLK